MLRFSYIPTKGTPMDVVIYTSDPDRVDTLEVQGALEDLGYFVLSVTVEDRGR